MVFASYWNQPEETDRAIRDGWFHTGDLDAWDEVGSIHIADPKKDVSNVFLALHDMIAQDANKLGMFTLPGLGKITVVKKPATKARKGINPFTGEPTVFKAKPARKVVKIRALKNLKDAVN